MSIKKYLSLERLAEYDALLKAKIAQDDSATLESAKTYVDEKFDGHVHSWNDLNDKPFEEVSEAKTYLYDKALEYEETNADSRFHFVKISNDVPSQSDLIGGKFIGYGYYGEDIYDITSDDFDRAGCNCIDCYEIFGNIVVATSENASFEYFPVTPGIWVYNRSDFDRTILALPASIKTLDEKFIPDTIARVEDINTSITNITNGNVVVKEAEHATSADSATSATTAESATKAAQDGNGAVIADTYETKTDAAAKLTEAKEYVDGKFDGHTHSWNELEDKPFGEGEEIVLTWDGNLDSIDYKAVIIEDIDDVGNGEKEYWCRISEEVPDVSKMRMDDGMPTVGWFTEVVEDIMYGSRNENEAPMLVVEDTNIFENTTSYTKIGMNGVVIIKEPNVIIKTPNDEVIDPTLEKPGIYVCYRELKGSSSHDKSYVGSVRFNAPSVQTLDSKFIGADIARQTDVDSLSAKVGAVPEGQTVMGIIENIQENAYDDTALVERIAKAETDIDTVASAVELLTNGVDAETVDGVNDLIQYVNEHGAEVTGMKDEIKANTDAIAGLSEVAKTGSWNELLDKPFDEAVLAPHTESKSYLFIENGDKFSADMLYFDAFESGKTYTVIFDSVTYECQPIDLSQTIGAPLVCLGNPTVAGFPGNDTGEHFCIAYVSSSPDQSMIITMESGNSHMVGIYEASIKTIDEKFIPDTIARVSDIPTVDLTPYETKVDANSKLAEAKAYTDERIEEFVEISAEDINRLFREPEILEGDGSEYYTLAPTALTFRSTEPLADFQEVKVNGEVVDPSNYTLEEGSTIVKLSIDYLKTLPVGAYSIDVASVNNTVSGGFTVAAPELNEHGFYYNQPYTANLPMFGGDTAFFVHEDGTFDIITVGKDLTTSTYTVDGNNIVAIVPPLGTVNCTISTDGTSIYCNEVATTFELNASIAITADDDYVYEYKEDLGGYEVRCIDKTKAEYGAIKTGINGIDTVKLADEMYYRPDGVASSLIHMTIPHSVVVIGGSAFKNCKNLTSVTIPDSVTTIGESAFYSCSALASLDIPNSVTSIGDSAFNGAGMRKIREVPGNVSVINNHTFSNSFIVNIALGEGITNIGNSAFANCKHLNSIEIPSSVISIGNFAFMSCITLMDITYNGTISQWKAIEKGQDWDKYTAQEYNFNSSGYTYRNYTIHCADGDITADD